MLIAARGGEQTRQPTPTESPVAAVWAGQVGAARPPVRPSIRGSDGDVPTGETVTRMGNAVRRGYYRYISRLFGDFLLGPVTLIRIPGGRSKLWRSGQVQLLLADGMEQLLFACNYLAYLASLSHWTGHQLHKTTNKKPLQETAMMYTYVCE